MPTQLGAVLLVLAVFIYSLTVIRFRKGEGRSVRLTDVAQMALSCLFYILGAWIVITPFRPLSAIMKAWWIGSVLFIVWPTILMVRLHWLESGKEPSAKISDVRYCFQSCLIGYLTTHLVCLTMGWVSNYLPTNQLASSLVCFAWFILVRLFVTNGTDAEKKVGLAYAFWLALGTGCTLMAVFMMKPAYPFLSSWCRFGGCTMIVTSLIWLFLAGRIVYLREISSPDRGAISRTASYLSHFSLVLFFIYTLAGAIGLGTLS